MNDQPNLDPWTYSREQRPLDFLNFAAANGATIPTCQPRGDVINVDFLIESFYDYIIDNEEICQKKWFHPRDILSPESNVEMALPLQVGLHQGNTFEYNWGLYGDSSEQIKKLIGHDNLTKMGLITKTVLARLIIYMPGHGIPWHRDTMDGWMNKFTHLNPDNKNKTCDLGPVKRKLLMVSSWHWGQMLQLDNEVKTHWASGDVYDIPIGQWHCSANQGVLPKITVSLTGVSHG